MSDPLFVRAESEMTDDVPERAAACRALAALGVPPEKLEELRSVDVVSRLSPVAWATLGLRMANEQLAKSTWGWAEIARGEAA